MDVRSERRLVSCLFIDVVGSTDATVRLRPERMQRLLRETFAEMSKTIAQHGGTIETYVGDAIFALFGAPVAQADDAGAGAPRGGSQVAGAVGAAIREEAAAARGGPPPKHAELRGLGCLGISELLQFRPGSSQAV